MWILAQILTELTGKPRYKPEIKWADSPSWTHNIFRVYEMIFWRRYGIKAEMSALADPYGNVFYACHSWESVFALTEQYIRAYFASWKLLPFKIYIPVFQTPQGIPVFASPYLFAIAFDAAAGNYNLNTLTVSLTCTGSNLNLMCGSGGTGAADPYVSLTYAAVQMTALHANTNYAGTEWTYHYYLTAPSTGTNNAVLTSFNSWGEWVNYSGVSQTGFPDSSATNSGTTETTITATTTVVASNCWLHAFMPLWQANTGTAGSGTTLRTPTGNAGTRSCADSNGTVGTGSQSLVITADTNPVGWYTSIVSMAPPSVATTRHLLGMMGIGK